MNENLIEQKSGKPEGLPEKFWNEEKKQINIDALVEDYLYLVSRDNNLIEGNNRNIPESFDKYEINIASPLLERDDDVLKKLFENGFSNQQAQVVYDLANERVIPCLNEMASEFESKRQLEKLNSYFGSKEKFDEVSRQISNWAKENISNEAYDALATTAEGVIALYKMMSSNEPVIGVKAQKEDDLSEDKLKQMMQDPRYWRDKDKAYIEKITKGFQTLYPNK